MSVEDAVTDGLQAPLDQNAQSTEDVKKMLAELEGESAPKNDQPATDKQETSGNGESKEDNDALEANTTEDAVAPPRPDEDEDGREHRRERREYNNRGRGDRGDRRGGRGRGRGDYQPRNYRDNVKSDLTAQEPSDDPVAIRKQVEFYFSDSNLPQDKFLLGLVSGSKNNAVELKTLHTFKRMRHFQPFEAIVDAMKESTFLNLVNDDTCVQRKEPLPAELDDGPVPDAVKVFEDRAMPRSVYVKGFGEEDKSTFFDIEAFFAPHGPVNAVRLRRSDDKVFKGSVFVEFKDEETAQKFLELDPKPKYHDKDLQIMSKKEYCEKKVEDIKAGKIRPNNRHEKHSERGDRGGRDFKRKRDGDDNRDWRERRDEDRKNGFRDDRRGNDRDRGRGGRGRGGRGSREETDRNGIPKVRATVDEKTKHERAKEEALANARAIVEAENRKLAEAEQKGADDVEATEQDGNTDATTRSANVVEESIKADIDATVGKNGDIKQENSEQVVEDTQSKKRARVDDEGDNEREAKKVDVKEE